METISTTEVLRQRISACKQQAKRVAFVPTMGNLHVGHLSLIKRAKALGDVVVASIFVNPMQFGVNEDLDNYPRTMAEDKEKLAAEGTDLLFAPGVSEIYPSGMDQQTQVIVPGLTHIHCGASRPVHFTGVATVVTKLFGIVQPDIAVFGEKDFQQLAVIRKLVVDLCLPVEIIGEPTGRASDGLALSSRNGYLTKEERQTAPLLYQLLQQCRQDIAAGKRDFKSLEQQYSAQIEQADFSIDYFSICDSITLGNVTGTTELVVILVAASLGNTRLIDNITYPLIGAKE
jgi:pantoate--beta-alanine ligase